MTEGQRSAWETWQLNLVVWNFCSLCLSKSNKGPQKMASSSAFILVTINHWMATQTPPVGRGEQLQHAYVFIELETWKQLLLLTLLLLRSEQITVGSHDGNNCRVVTEHRNSTTEVDGGLWRPHWRVIRDSESLWTQASGWWSACGATLL